MARDIKTPPIASTVVAPPVCKASPRLNLMSKREKIALSIASQPSTLAEAAVGYGARQAGHNTLATERQAPARVNEAHKIASEGGIVWVDPTERKIVEKLGDAVGRGSVLVPWVKTAEGWVQVRREQDGAVLPRCPSPLAIKQAAAAAAAAAKLAKARKPKAAPKARKPKAPKLPKGAVKGTAKIADRSETVVLQDGAAAYEAHVQSIYLEFVRRADLDGKPVPSLDQVRPLVEGVLAMRASLR